MPAGSAIPGLSWYHRGERRYVEYGSSFQATLVEGAHQAINDAILNLNHLHLSPAATTLFEAVEDAGRVAGSINYYVFRGRMRHPLKHPRAVSVARRIGVFDAAYGPTRFHFGELFASERTGARRNLGVGVRHDAHAAEVGAHLVRADAFDFLLYYLPDLDMASHRRGPGGAGAALDAADRAIGALLEAAGGIDAFVDRYRVILCADHGQTAVTHLCDPRSALTDLVRFRGSRRVAVADAQVAVAASNRAAMVYRLAGAPAASEIAARLDALAGVDVVAYREADGYVAVRAGQRLVYRRDLSAAADGRGNRFARDGDLGTLSEDRYPNGLERLAGLLDCINAGEVVASAATGVEFVDNGGGHHLGGGSHGSLSADDSTVPLVTVGLDVHVPAQPSITDVYRLVLEGLGLRVRAAA